MKKPKLISSLNELYESTMRFDRLIREEYDELPTKLQKVVQNAFSHARSFIVFPRSDGQGYYIGFSKGVGYHWESLNTYDKVRKHISGSDSERAINALGLSDDYNLGSANNSRSAPSEITEAVKDFIGIAGKTPNTLSWIRLMPLPEALQNDEFERTKVYEVLLAAIKAARLTKVEREHLIAEIGV